MKNIERQDYMNTLIGLRDKNLIKVLTGVRRCGKSTVMQMFRNYLLVDNVRGNQINIGKARNTEIDFVVRKPNGEQDYIQVAWTAKETATFEREIRPFELIKDFNRRILLTTDIEPTTVYKGIQKINVVDWLLENEF